MIPIFTFVISSYQIILTTKNNKKMEKKSYEAMKQLKQKVESGLATFQERTKWKIIEKRKAKGQPIHYS